jgi:hypothetical protein
VEGEQKLRKEIFTSMLQWVEYEMKHKPHTEEEMLFIDAVLEFAVDGISKTNGDSIEK